MILTGPEIRRQIELGNIEIDPYVPGNVGPNSVDLTLGRQIVEYDVSFWKRERTLAGLGPYARDWLDAREENPTFTHSISDMGYLLEPNRLYLMHTVERTFSKTYLPQIDGKSSIGRLGVLIHFTAGRGDVGFNGQWTLEVMCVHPVKLYADMKIAQVTFMTVLGEVEDYRERGNYVGETARGPVASRSWRQFK